MQEPDALTAVRFKELETRGFLVIRGVLSAAEVQMFRNDFEAQPLDPNLNYRIARSSSAANVLLKALIEPLLVEINRTTKLQVDYFDGGIYFDTGPRHGVRFNWHQDAESIFRFQNHYDYLNFYMPLVKPLKEKSNLCIVPFDALERADPNAFRHLVGGGAAGLLPVGHTPVWICGDTGKVHRMRAGIERLAETPLLDVGDLVIMRGDVVHRTQDADTERVALSIRIARSSAVIHRRRLVAGGPMKATIMSNNAPLYERMFKVFDDSGRTSMRVDEMQAALAALPTGPAKSSKAFMRYLMRQKLRSGQLGSFIASYALTNALTWYARAFAASQRRAARARENRKPVPTT